MVDNELMFGRYNKQVDYRNGKIDQVLEHRVESMLPASGTNIELVVEVLRDLLIESLGGGYKSLGVEVDLRADKTIKVIRKTSCRRVDS